jgi:hypothetical protein
MAGVARAILKPAGVIPKRSDPDPSMLLKDALDIDTCDGRRSLLYIITSSLDKLDMLDELVALKLRRRACIFVSSSMNPASRLRKTHLPRFNR